MGPSIPVLSVEEMKTHLRIDIPDEDALIADYIDAATKMVEDEAEIALLTQTWTLTLDNFPCWEIELRRVPVQSITSIVYLDSTGASTTLSASSYRLDAQSKPARVTPTYNTVWPVTYPTENAVTVTFVAGSTTVPSAPDIAKQAIRLLVAHWYRGREAVVATGAQPIELPLAYDACISRLKWSGGV
jgi:uncharacterized phiE125 gp8 family phage protein